MKTVIERAIAHVGDDEMEQLTVRVRIGTVKMLRNLAVQSGTSVNAFVSLILNEAVDEYRAVGSEPCYVGPPLEPPPRYPGEPGYVDPNVPPSSKRDAGEDR